MEAFASPGVFNALNNSVVATEQRTIEERLTRVVQARFFREEDRIPTNGISHEMMEMSWDLVWWI